MPKNSVGTAQLKDAAVTGKKIARDAVSGDKIADGQVTGADVVESSLGQVPSAASAANAGNAATVGGLAPSTFARADRFYAGDADPRSLTPATLIALPNGPVFETDGDSDSAFEVRMRNRSTDGWDLSTEGSNSVSIVAPGSFVFIGSLTSSNLVTWMVRNTNHTDRYALVECGYHPDPNRIECFARVSPAL